MNWRDRYDTERITEGTLRIVGGIKSNSARVQSLTHAEAMDLVKQIALGVDGHNIHTLSLVQIKLPKNSIHFREFVEGLLGISQLTQIDFCHDSTYSPIFTPKQCNILLEAVATIGHLRSLIIRTADDLVSAKTVAVMLAKNTGLRHFKCRNLSDDLWGYAVTKSAIMSSQLKVLELDMTVCSGEVALPAYPEGREELTIHFGHRYSRYYPAIPVAQAGSVQERTTKERPAEEKKAVRPTQIHATLYSNPQGRQTQPMRAVTEFNQPAEQGPPKRQCLSKSVK